MKQLASRAIRRSRTSWGRRPTSSEERSMPSAGSTIGSNMRCPKNSRCRISRKLCRGFSFFQTKRISSRMRLQRKRDKWSRFSPLRVPFRTLLSHWKNNVTACPSSECVARQSLRAGGGCCLL